MDNVLESAKSELKDEMRNEELLGSFTTYNYSDGPETKNQVRTSARVFKKQKLDSETTTTITPTCEQTEQEMDEEVKMEVHRKPLRPSWSYEDKNLFFEALNYYGKDFEAIRLYIASKLKRKGVPESILKTKDQVRHFYYRSWHKISKYLKFSQGVKKITQELYGLINYGELRKKVGSVSEKIRIKLNELMYRGSVAIRCRGKTIRIKTPICRTLRKLNQLDEKQEEPKLPTRILVEIIPKDMRTWMQVQSIAQNPRVQTFLPLQKRLSSLIEYLNMRWKSPFASAHERAFVSATTISNEGVLTGETSEEISDTLHPYLRMSPSINSVFQEPSICLGEYLTSHSICLSAYEERMGITPTTDGQWWSYKGYTKNVGTKQSQMNESLNEKLSINGEVRELKKIAEKSNTDISVDVQNDSNKAVYAILSVAESTDKPEEMKKYSTTKINNYYITDDSELNLQEKNKALNSQHSWTKDECGNLTIGELYLKFGCNSKLILEYSWEFKTEKNTNRHIADDLTSQTKNIPDINQSTDNLSVTLQMLISLAKRHFHKNVFQCCCNCTNDNRNVAPKIKVLSNKKVNLVDQKDNIEAAEVATNSDEEMLESRGLLESQVVSNFIHSNINSTSNSDVFQPPQSSDVEILVKTQLNSAQHPQAKCCSKNRRLRHNKVVVERRLPLLTSKDENGHQIVQMNIISHEPDLKLGTSGKAPAESESHVPTTADMFNFTESLAMGSSDEADLLNSKTTANIDAHLMPVVKPTEIEPSLDLIQTGCSSNNQNGAITNQDHVFVMADSLKVDDMVCGPSTDLIGCSTPATSPTHILKENENHWLNAEVTDFSLSSFLGNLESSNKSNPASPIHTAEVEDSRLSQDVDAHVHTLLTENSMDYVNKFADLAQQVELRKDLTPDANILSNQ